MTFQELLLEFERRLGYHHVPLNPAARGIKDVFESSPVHHDLMIRLARAVFAANGCQRLTDPVARDKTFAAFAPIRVEVLRSDKCDVDAHRLIDELCTALEQIFRSDRPRLRADRSAGAAAAGNVVAFDVFRRRRTLKTWT
jgi:hypothetical protein